MLTEGCEVCATLDARAQESQRLFGNSAHEILMNRHINVAHMRICTR